MLAVTDGSLLWKVKVAVVTLAPELDPVSVPVDEV
jgi:hypothetical protein